MIWHPLADWVAGEPVTGQPIHWDVIDTVVIHYTAAINLIDGDPGEDWAGIPAYLRRIHHDYLTNRPTVKDGVVVSTGYSIGYNAAVDARGHAWELRGFDIQCAANRGHNHHTWAILMLVDGQSGGSGEALAAARELIGLASTRAHHRLPVASHSAFGATQCCGDGLRAQILTGQFEPTHPAPAPVDPLSEEDDMPYAFSVTDREQTGRAMVLIANGSGDTQALSTPGRPDDFEALHAAVTAERNGRAPTPLVVHSDTFDGLAAGSLAENTSTGD